jgi:Uma2 family endonuclease
MLARRLDAQDDTPVEDQIVVLRDATWADFQRMLELKGDRTAPRLAFLEGVLEIMSPSRSHEALKSLIGQLVEVFCLAKGIDFNAYGSWTLEDKASGRGIEPDECYVFGDGSGAARPELAIEVIWTSGGPNKLEIYRGLGVPEVWIWRQGRITAHVLRGDRYEQVTASARLPGIDLAELAGLLDRPTASQAIREYRAALERRG